MDASQGAPEAQGRGITRRTFIADLGRGAFVLATVAISACLPGTGAGAPTSTRPNASASTRPSVAGSSRRPVDGAWHRVRLGHVSAYIFVRSGEAAIIDTGDPGGADEIGYSLGTAGLDWSAVGHLVLTHRHTDHVGSAADVLAHAPGATVYAGAEDAAAIKLGHPIQTVADGDRVFDLTVVTTPGHTPGSISVYDPVGGVVCAGDALATDRGVPVLPSVRSPADLEVAKASIAKLGALTFDTLLVGHGAPVESGAKAMVDDLLDTTT